MLNEYNFIGIIAYEIFLSMVHIRSSANLKMVFKQYTIKDEE